MVRDAPFVARLAAVLLLVPLGTGACSGLQTLDEKPADLSENERTAVRVQVDKAVADGTFGAAWDQEVHAGADRGRLEAIALAALEKHSRHAPDMFAALREKWGALTPAGRARISEWSETAQRNGEWGRALELELVTADDPPAYERAWGVYKRAPSLRATDLLEEIQDARAAHAEDAAASSKGSGG